jgi:hypothetical protein
MWSTLTARLGVHVVDAAWPASTTMSPITSARSHASRYAM